MTINSEKKTEPININYAVGDKAPNVPEHGSCPDQSVGVILDIDIESRLLTIRCCGCYRTNLYELF